MPSIVGASGVEKQESLCLIQLVSCKYKLRGKVLSAVLYTGSKQHCTELSASDTNSRSMEGDKLYGGISNDLNKCYIISHNQGTDIELKCTRNANLCDNESHRQFEIYYPDAITNKLKQETHDITEKEFKIYYYNLFDKAQKWSSGASKSVWKSDYDLDSRLISLPLAYGGGWVAGNVIDFLTIFRFIHLPKLKSQNDQFIYDIQYYDCYNNPNLYLIVYPDVEFSVKIGGTAFSNKIEGGDNAKREAGSTNFMFEFGIKYGRVQKEIGYSAFQSIEKKVEDSPIYKSLKYIGRFFNATANVKEELAEIIGNTDNALESGTKGILKSSAKIDRAVGGKLLNVQKWLSGSFSIDPSLSAKWYYDTSSDLRQILRHIELSLTIACKGELKIDLVAIFLEGFRKARKLTTIAALVSAIGSLGIGAILSALIKFLVDVVVTWLINKVKEGFKFNLILSANVKCTALKFDSLADTKFSSACVEICPEIRLELGVEAKTSISLFIITVSGEIDCSVEASTSLFWKMTLNSNEDNLGVDNELYINPFTIKIGICVVGSMEISIKKKTQTEKVKTGSELGYKSDSKTFNWSPEWKADKIDCDIDRWVWFEFDKKDKDETNTSRYAIN